MWNQQTLILGNRQREEKRRDKVQGECCVGAVSRITREIYGYGILDMIII